MLVLNGEVRHIIDDSSPLYGRTEGKDAVVVKVVMSSIESVFKKDFYAAHVYRSDRKTEDGGQIISNHKFTDYLHLEGEKFVVDLGKFHDIEPQTQDSGLLVSPLQRELV